MSWFWAALPSRGVSWQQREQSHRHHQRPAALVINWHQHQRVMRWETAGHCQRRRRRGPSSRSRCRWLEWRRRRTDCRRSPSCIQCCAAGLTVGSSTTHTHTFSLPQYPQCNVNTVRMIVPLGYWVLPNICKYWVLSDIYTRRHSLPLLTSRVMDDFRPVYGLSVWSGLVVCSDV